MILREAGTLCLYRLSLHQPASKINLLRRKKINSLLLEDLRLKTLDLHVGYSTSSGKTFHLCFLTSFIVFTKIYLGGHALKRLYNGGCFIKTIVKRHTSHSFLLVMCCKSGDGA